MAGFTVNGKNVINETISFYGTVVPEEKGEKDEIHSVDSGNGCWLSAYRQLDNWKFMRFLN